MYCKNCGVELESDMLSCPLCGNPVTTSGSEQPVIQTAPDQQLYFPSMKVRLNKPQKKFTWDIVSIVLLSGMVATLIIDFILNKGITWAEYPVAIGFTIFSFVSLFAFWEQKTILQITGGCLLSAAFLILLDLFTGGITWSFKLGVPLLLTGSLVSILLVIVIQSARDKGVNLLAYIFMALAIQSVCIEGIVSFFETGSFKFRWSMIVIACVIPVFLVLLFMHFRLKKGRSLEKTFHI